MKGDELYAWQELTDDGWGTIAGYIALIGVTAPLVARKLEVALTMSEVAHMHVAETGCELRLGKFEFKEVVAGV